MKLNSKQVTVEKSAAEICEYLSNVENYEQLMPENKSKFEVLNENAFVFGLKGMPEISLEIKEKNCPYNVVLGAMDEKFPFTLTGNINSVSDASAEVQLNFEGKFNPMMAMMIKGPISKFIDTLAENIEKL